MTAGERNFSTSGKKAVKFEFKVPPSGDYQGKLQTSGCAVAKKSEPGKFPYISGFRIELLDTAEEGGKNSLVFHNLFTSLKPGRNGDVMPERADQIVGLAHAMGEEYEGGCIVLQDENGDDVECLNPKELVEWLKAHDGQIVSLHTKYKAANKDYGAKAEVQYFVEVESDNAFGTGETAAEAEEEIEEEVEEVVEVKPAKKAAKPALKVANGKRR